MVAEKIKVPILAIYGTPGKYIVSGHKPALRTAFEQVHLELSGLLASEDNRGRRADFRVIGVAGFHAMYNSSMLRGQSNKKDKY
jgi:dienelactone hydrolase